MSKKNTTFCGVSKRHFRRLVAKEMKNISEIENRDSGSKNINIDQVFETEIGQHSENNSGTSSLDTRKSEIKNYEFASEDFENNNDMEIDSEEKCNSKKLHESLQNWGKKNNINHTAFNDLLIVLRNNGLNVPKNIKSLLKTPRMVCIIKNIADGEYLNIGIKYYFENKLNIEDFPDNILLNIGIDGLPLSKSSGLCLWPILALVQNVKNSTPIVIGAYSG